MSEQDFFPSTGDRYRGSRYASFVGGDINAQGNISPAARVSNPTQAAQTVAAPTEAAPVSSNLLAPPKAPSATKQLGNAAIGAVLPYAGKEIGQVAGEAIGSGASIGAGLTSGVNSLANKAGSLLGDTASTPASAAVASSSARSVTNAGSAASSAGNVGAGVGAGLGTFIAGLATGQSVGKAAKSGVGSGLGTYIGSAFGPVGGFIGGTIGSMIFCFTGSTPIIMANGEQKLVKDLIIGDETLVGCKVTGFGQSLSDDLYWYKNTKVTGSHAVFENGKWLRVEQSELSRKIDENSDDWEDIVHPVSTELCILVTPYFVSADINEVHETWNKSEDERIIELNSMTERNKLLENVEESFCDG